MVKSSLFSFPELSGKILEIAHALKACMAIFIVKIVT